MLLNFAAHSPEDTNATENTVLRAFNRPDRRHRSSTERRFAFVLASPCVIAVSWGSPA
jgi:hypothetical protein